MPTYILSNGQLIDKHTGEPCTLPAWSGAPAIRRDSMPTVKSMVDGSEYSSRSDYDAHLRKNGHRIADKGEKPTEVAPKWSDKEKRNFAEGFIAQGGRA